MSSAALRIVTEALRDRIKTALGADVHVGPLDDLEAKDARLVLFLYGASRR